MKITEEMRKVFYREAFVLSTGTVLNLDAALTAAIIESRTGDAESWQPIETAPKDNSPMLLCCVDWAHSTLRDKPIPIKVGGWDVEGSRWHIFGASWRPTHWMHLPNPPTTIDT